MPLAVDTETTGLDLRHGAKPFIVTLCDEQGINEWWEWDVDPLTREPKIPKGDLTEIKDRLDEADRLVLQNSRFDVLAFETVDKRISKGWDWSKTDDTLIIAHMLRSDLPKGLEDLVRRYLRTNIRKYETDVEEAVKEARRIVRRKYKRWAIAKAGRPDMPSAKEKVWKFDMWLPRAVAIEEGYDDDHPWFEVTVNYANIDTAVLNPLLEAMTKVLEEQKLQKIYAERKKIVPVIYGMESRGVTFSKSRLDELYDDYKQGSEESGRVCCNIAKSLGYDLELPKSGNNKSLTEFCFGPLNLPVIEVSKKTGAPSLNKDVLDSYIASLPGKSKQAVFVKHLRAKRKRDTALSYMESYRRFAVDIGDDDIQRLYPTLNPVGTATLRMSSSNPNEQNISKQGVSEEDRRNLRHAFGPAPGREWWSLDYDNLELRIPAYESGEPAMLKLFEEPDAPPYYGSYHLLVFDLLHPQRFAKHGTEVKNVFKSTWYQWTKNGNFAELYGAVETSGTADRAFHVPGAQRRVAERLTKKSALNTLWVDHATKHGYVETIPDKDVDPDRGYRLYCQRGDRGQVKPTQPLNYHVQGTACWIMMRAMIAVQSYLDRLNAKLDEPAYFMVMNVHDEIVLDFPKGKTPKYNLPKVRKVRSIMASFGVPLGVKLTCGIDYHPETWAKTTAI